MSRPQAQHRPLVSFGNPFRMIKPKVSDLSPKLLSLLNSFEETLTGRLKNLKPTQKEDVLKLSWMKSAMESLCGIHTDIKTLLTALELPVSDWDDKWLDVYLANSIKLLDICNIFSSEINRLKQGNLYLQCVLHNLTSNQFVRARSSIDGFNKQISSKNPRLENCSSVMDSLLETLDLPKIKNSAKGKVLMRAMYGVKVVTLFICSLFATAFSGNHKKLVDLQVPETYLWAKAFLDFQGFVNTEIRSVLYCSGRVAVLKELEGVDTCVKKVYPIVQDGVVPVESGVLKNLTSDLEKSAENYSQGLEMLAKEVDNFFQIVLTGRDALLSNLRVGGNVSDKLQTNNNNVKYQKVR